MSRRQRGAALLAAMLTVTLVASFAAAALWQQWRAVEVEAAERSRIQASWILTGALDWARLILREDRSGADHLGEPWAVPLQEARLSTFLAADPSNNTENESDRTFLSGQITDLQGRLNINSLVQAGSVKPGPQESFRRLFEVLGLPQAELERLTANLRFAWDISTDNLNAARAPLPPRRVEQLVWLGLSPETAAALAPFVALLPESNTPVNVNTASPEVIYAIGRNISLADAQRLVAERSRQHFANVPAASARLGADAGFQDGMAGVRSEFFEVRGRLRLDDVVIEERSVVQQDGREIRTIERERGVLHADALAPPGTAR